MGKRFLLKHQLGKNHVGHKNHYVAHNHSICAGLSHFYRSALDSVSVESRDAGDDVSEEKRLYECEPHVPLDEFGLDSVDVSINIDYTCEHANEISAK